MGKKEGSPRKKEGGGSHTGECLILLALAGFMFAGGLYFDGASQGYSDVDVARDPPTGGTSVQLTQWPYWPGLALTQISGMCKNSEGEEQYAQKGCTALVFSGMALFIAGVCGVVSSVVIFCGIGGQVISKFGLLGVTGGFLFAYAVELFRIVDQESGDGGFCDSLADQDENKCIAYSFQACACFVGAIVQFLGMLATLCKDKEGAGAQCLKTGMFGFACFQISLSSRQYLLASLDGAACDSRSDAAAGGDCAAYAISGTMWMGGAFFACLCSLATACSSKNVSSINALGMLALAGFYGGYMSEVWNLVDTTQGGGIGLGAPCDSNNSSACGAVVVQALFWTMAFSSAIIGTFQTCRECTHNKALLMFAVGLGCMLMACATERWYQVSNDDSVCGAPEAYGDDAMITDKMCFTIVIEAIFYTGSAFLAFAVYGTYVASSTI